MVRFSLFVAATAAALCAIWRIYQFGDIDLISDQAFFTQWVKRLSESTSFLPLQEGGAPWKLQLIRDETNFLGILLGQIYQAHALLFTVTSVSLYLIVSALCGASVETIVGVSIACSAIASFLLFAFPAFIRGIAGISDRGAVTMIATILVFGCVNSFFNVFSALGPHNAGVLTLMISVIVTQIWISRTKGGTNYREARLLTIVLFISHFATVYTHYANLFILPVATLFAVALHPGTRHLQRIVSISKYSSVMLIAFIPAIVLMIVYEPSIGGHNSKQTFGGLKSTFVVSNNMSATEITFTRISHWFREVTAFYSIPGLALGLVGILGLARRNGIFLPFTIVLTHFLIGISVGVFGQYDRTAAYLLPMLMLGGGWTIYTAGAEIFCNSRPALVSRIIALISASIVAISAALHVAIELPRLAAPESVKKWGALVGTADWKPLVADFDRRIPDGSYLIPWDYGTHHQYRSMSHRAGQTIKVMRPLETLNSQRESGFLQKYIHTRGLTLSADNPIFILAPKTIARARLKIAFSNVAGADGFKLTDPKSISLITERALPREKHWPGGVRLYLVEW